VERLKSYIITYRSYKLLNMVEFLAHPVYILPYLTPFIDEPIRNAVALSVNLSYR